jgi:hypothetical protein
MRAVVATAGKTRLIVSNGNRQGSVALVAYVATFLLAFGVYMLTLSPDLTWRHYGGDGGELITASYTLGVPHPPGYPSYVLLGRAFSVLPVGTVVLRYHLFSALCGAVAASFVTAACASLRRAGVGHDAPWPVKSSCVAAGLLFAFSGPVWGQSVIAEVYSLNLAVVGALIWSLVRKPGRRSLLLVGFLFGLSLTTHLTSLLLLPMVLARTSRGQLRILLAGTVVGLSPYAALPLLAAGDSPVVWFRPETLGRWWELASAQIYRPNVLALSLVEWPVRLIAWLSKAAVQLAALVVVLFLMHRSGRLSIVVGRAQGLLLVTAAIFGAYAFTYDSFDAVNYLLPGVLLLAVALGSSMDTSGSWALLLPGVLLAVNLPSQPLVIADAAEGSALRRQAESSLSALPPGAVAITPGDESIFALWYFREVEGYRTDIALVDAGLFQFDWYRQRLAERFPTLADLEEDDLAAFVNGNLGRSPICRVALLPPQDPDCVGSGGGTKRAGAKLERWRP